MKQWPDIYLGEESVEAMHLLSLLHKSIILRNPFQGEFLHQVDLIGFSKEPFFEILHSNREGGWKEQNLPILRKERDDFFHQRLKFGREKFICLEEPWWINSWS